MSTPWAKRSLCWFCQYNLLGFCNCSMFCCALLCVHSSFAIILMGKREMVALLCSFSWCLMIVVWLFLSMPRVCLQFVIVLFPDHTHLLFLGDLTKMFLKSFYSIISVYNLVYMFLFSFLLMMFISYRSYYCIATRWPDKLCLSHGMCLYQVIMTLHFFNVVVNDIKTTRKSRISS